MNIAINEERWIKFLKPVNTISIFVWKFSGILFISTLLITIVNDYFGPSRLVEEMANLSFSISFWIGLFFLLINNILDNKIAKLERDGFSEALKGIDDLSENLENIQKFLKKTQASIIDTRRELEKMKQEKDLLEPVLKTDQDSVKKILAQARHHHANRWKEYLLSFVLGIAASMVSGLINKHLL